eukprot:gene7088-14420_t
MNITCLIICILSTISICHAYRSSLRNVPFRKQVISSANTEGMEFLTSLSPPDIANLWQKVALPFGSPEFLNVETLNILNRLTNFIDENLLLTGSIDINVLASAVWTQIEVICANPATVPLFLVSNIFYVILGGWSDDRNVGSPYAAGSSTYDVQKSAQFYNSRPLFVIRRLLRLAQLTGIFNAKLLLDWRTGKLEENQKERAKEALVLATQLGPTFIKLGQALSIRTDLIPEAYALELRQLQDAVPPFDTSEAMSILRSELDIDDLKDRFRTITSQPIASASIGQVYKATLTDGKEVAVKVQRPQVLGEIALDLYILRLITPLQVTISNAVSKRKTEQADIDVALSLVDEWGRGFVAEVDYRLEARNGKQFLEAMGRLGLDAVTAPAVVDDLSRDRVLVTEWVDGTRLDRDVSPDVPRLCGVAVNAYLTMLLDTGVLHCDPHPGNLLRTLDGRLCILDWGMTLQVPKDLQYGLLEFIAHVNTEDYDSLPEDFVNIGFSPPEKLAQLKNSGLTEGLSFVLRQLNKGGGPSKIRDRVKEEFKSRYGESLSDEELRAAARQDMIEQMQLQLKKEGVDVNGVTEVMEQMSRRNRELFRLPPYVLYVSRAFSTLEGIGLSVDENYSILQESYPYLSKRLMSDNSPRAKQALRTMLYESSSSGGGMLSVKKLVEMTDGFSSYTAATANADRDSKGVQAAGEALSSLLLSSEGNFMQELVLEGAAKMTDSLLREGVSRVETSQGGQFVTAALQTSKDLVDRLVPGPLQPLALPLTLPYEIGRALHHLLSKDETDEAAISAARDVLEFVKTKQQQAGQSQDVMDSVFGLISGNSDVDGVGTTEAKSRSRSMVSVARNELRKVLSDPGVVSRGVPVAATLSRRLVASLLTRAAERMDDKRNRLHASRGTDTGLDMMSQQQKQQQKPLLSDSIIDVIASVSASTARSAATAITPITNTKQ